MGDKPKTIIHAPIDVYDEEFHNSLKLAKGFINQLGSKGGKNIRF